MPTSLLLGETYVFLNRALNCSRVSQQRLLSASFCQYGVTGGDGARRLFTLPPVETSGGGVTAPAFPEAERLLGVLTRFAPMIESFGGWRGGGARGVIAAQPGVGIGQPPAHVKVSGLFHRRRFSQRERLTVIL
jgi:hypothetical protein